MKRIYTFILLICSAQFLTAQVIVDQPSVGPGYTNMTFYNLDNGETTEYEHPTWDIAFSVGTFDAGVLFNEAVGLSFTNPFPQVEMYLTTATDFATVDTVGSTQIFNNEISWSEGALNHVADPSNPSDLGWGDYAGGGATGSRIFAIKLRNGSFKKLQIQSLASGIYTFQYADMDGSNEVTATIDKADYTGKTLAYYSMETGNELDLEPTDWDMVFTRYATPLDDGAGGTIDYNVTGVLTNKGVQVAQADDIAPSTVNHEDYTNEYNDTLTTIGHDWKNFQGSWVVDIERVYFVKTTDEKIWKVLFFDFEGSSSGISSLEKEEVTTTSTNKIENHLSTYEVYPNPATGFTNIVFDLKTFDTDATLQIINPLGQEIYSQTIEIQNGLNAKRINLDYPSGLYHIVLRIENDYITRPLFIK